MAWTSSSIAVAPSRERALAWRTSVEDGLPRRRPGARRRGRGVRARSDASRVVTSREGHGANGSLGLRARPHPRGPHRHHRAVVRGRPACSARRSRSGSRSTSSSGTCPGRRRTASRERRSPRGSGPTCRSTGRRGARAPTGLVDRRAPRRPPRGGPRDHPAGPATRRDARPSRSSWPASPPESPAIGADAARALGPDHRAGPRSTEHGAERLAALGGPECDGGGDDLPGDAPARRGASRRARDHRPWSGPSPAGWRRCSCGSPTSPSPFCRPIPRSPGPADESPDGAPRTAPGSEEPATGGQLAQVGLGAGAEVGDDLRGAQPAQSGAALGVLPWVRP